MPKDDSLLNETRIFTAVVENGSLASAAEALGMTPSGVSRAVSRLEHGVGTRLLQRTTRASRLTAEGERFYADTASLLDGFADAVQRVTNASAVPGGHLRIRADPYFSCQVLAPHLAEFHSRYPDLTLEILAQDDIGDLVADRVDLAIRFGAAEQSSRLVTRRLLETRVLTVASPSYLAAHGRPAHPTELERHHCLDYRNPVTGRPFQWQFNRGNDVLPVATNATVTVSDVGTLVQAARSGAGIAQILALGNRHWLDQGELVELFPDWPDERFPLHVFYPTRRHAPARVRVFIDFCREKIAQD